MGEAHQTGSSGGFTDLRQTIPGSPARSNRRPIELGLPAIPDLRPLSRRVINATSTSLFHAPHSIFAKRLVCCADQLNPPRKTAVREWSGYGVAAPGAKAAVRSCDVGGKRHRLTPGDDPSGRASIAKWYRPHFRLAENRANLPCRWQRLFGKCRCSDAN